MYTYVFLRDKPFFLCKEHNCGRIKNKFWIYNIHVICCVKKKFHFLERWSKHVLRWPHDTCMCFQAVCLEIIWSDPHEYCKFSLFGNSLQNSQNILFPLPSKLSHLYYFSFHGNLHVFLVEAGVSDSVLISLSSDDCFPPKKEYSGPFTCFHFNILWHFVSWEEPRLLFSIFACSFFKRFVFGNSLFQGPFSTFWYDTKKITCISQRVMTLLVQRTSGEDEWLTVKFEHC